MNVSPEKRSREVGGEASAEPAAKRHETSHPAFAAISAAILQDDIPEQVATLLSGVVDSCLRKPKCQRQDYHEEVSAMLQEALTAADGNLSEKVQLADNDVEDKDTDKISKEATEARAQAKCNTLRVALRDKKKQVAADVVVLKEATQIVETAVTEQENGDTKFAEAKAQIDRLQEAEAKTLGPLKEGQFTGPKAKKQAAALASLGRRFDFDESLTSGLVEVLVKKPDERSPFDAMVISAFDTQLKTRIAEYERAVADETPGQETREKAVSEAKAKQEEAEKQKQTSETGARHGKEAVKQAQSALTNAQKQLKQEERALKWASCERDDAKAELRCFRDGPMAAFGALRAAADDLDIAAALKRFEEVTTPKQLEEVQPEIHALPSPSAENEIATEAADAPANDAEDNNAKDDDAAAAVPSGEDKPSAEADTATVAA